MNTRWMMTMFVGSPVLLTSGLYGCPERYEEPVGEIGEQLQEDLEAADEAVGEAVGDAVESVEESVENLRNGDAEHEQEPQEATN